MIRENDYGDLIDVYGTGLVEMALWTENKSEFLSGASKTTMATTDFVQVTTTCFILLYNHHPTN